jgi:hypothetical protein
MGDAIVFLAVLRVNPYSCCRDKRTEFARGSSGLKPRGVDRIAESVVSDSLGEREAVIEALYAAAMDPRQWPAALHCVACFVAGRDDEAIAALAFAEGPDVSKGWILASTELRGERTYDVATDAHPLLQGQATAGGDAVAPDASPPGRRTSRLRSRMRSWAATGRCTASRGFSIRTAASLRWRTCFDGVRVRGGATAPRSASRR